MKSPQDYFRPHQYIRKVEIHEAILNPPISWYGVGSPWMAASDQSRPFTFPIPKEAGRHRHPHDLDRYPVLDDLLERRQPVHRGDAADPKIEFILTEHPWMENDTLLSDIILPTTTRFEEYDISAGGGDVWMVNNCIAPIGEAKTDYEVSLEIAKKLGADLVQKYTWGRSVEDWMKYGWDTRRSKRSAG